MVEWVEKGGGCIPSVGKVNAYGAVQRPFFWEKGRPRGKFKPLGSGVPPPFVGRGPGRVEVSWRNGRAAGWGSVDWLRLRPDAVKVANGLRPALRGSSPWPPLTAASNCTGDNCSLRSKGLRPSGAQNLLPIVRGQDHRVRAIVIGGGFCEDLTPIIDAEGLVDRPAVGGRAQ